MKHTISYIQFIYNNQIQNQQSGVRAKIGTVWGASKDWDSLGCVQRLGQSGVRAKIGTVWGESKDWDGKGRGGMSVDWGILSTSFPGNQIRKI